jgi:uncharacterized OB-fold protein
MRELMTRTMCPTCGSVFAHLHPTRDLCPDPFHQPVPGSIQEWRLEVDRWASILADVATTRQPLDVPRALGLIVDDMRRELAATRTDEEDTDG